ncbi:MAG: pentapeptide repeat-containing protein [Desulfobacterales bacterium]
MNRYLGRKNPFVGLRPFDNEDSLYFFGRKLQTRALLKQLDSHRFVGVVGSSGCGKSSLVRAGLIPNLEAGFLAQGRDLWKMATFKPGDSPLRHLALALIETIGLSPTIQRIDSLLNGMRRQGGKATVDLLRDPLHDEDSNLLIVIDQFEELFRFRHSGSAAAREESAAFVSILIYLAEQTTVPIYVVLTMRSDFLGECDAFQGLPEVLNKSQYLVPRLTRGQRREAIFGPVRLAGAEITPRLMDRLLNENIDTRDDLPVLQHALMRTWEVWAEKADGPIDLEHYQRAGTLANALRLHADEALEGLDPDEGFIVKRLFQALTETDGANRRIRRPGTLKHIAAIVGGGISPKRLMSIINRINADGRNFLVLSSRTPEENPLVDISHESLIRQWKTLKRWVDEETESVRIYLRLAESMELFSAGKASLYKGTDLQAALEWKQEQKPTAEWGARYHSQFSKAMDFLKKSVNKQKTDWQFIISLILNVYACIYTWLVIATSDDVSLATNRLTLPILGTQMRADLVYLVVPLGLMGIYAWFLLTLKGLLWILSSFPNRYGNNGTLTSRIEEAGLRALAGLTVPTALLGCWLRFIVRRDWAVTGFHIVFLAGSILMAVLFYRSSTAKKRSVAGVGMPFSRYSVVGYSLLAAALFGLSFGVIKGVPERYLTTYGDLRGVVPWVFHQLGYDVFYDFRERFVSNLPPNYWDLSETDVRKAVRGANLKKVDLRYADMFQAFLAKANLRNSEMRGGRLRDADFRQADLRGANLEDADLRKGHFRDADFREATLLGVNFGKADLTNAQLGNSDMRSADFRDATLAAADMRCADLRNAKNLSNNHIKELKTLYGATMDDGFKRRVDTIKPVLMVKPSDTWHDMTTPFNLDKKDICE